MKAEVKGQKLIKNVSLQHLDSNQSLLKAACY